MDEIPFIPSRQVKVVSPVSSNEFIVRGNGEGKGGRRGGAELEGKREGEEEEVEG